MNYVDLPSQPFFEEYMTVVGWEVKQTRSTPYFLLLIVFKQLEKEKASSTSSNTRPKKKYNIINEW